MWFDRLFGAGEGLDGPFNLPRGANPGRHRPGRRSTEEAIERAIEEARRAQRQAPLAPNLLTPSSVFERRAPRVDVTDARVVQRSAPSRALQALADARAQQRGQQGRAASLVQPTRPAPRAAQVVPRPPQGKTSAPIQRLRPVLPPAPAPVATGKATGASRFKNRGMSGLGAVTGVPNAAVWVAAVEAPMETALLYKDGRIAYPMVWPDGTPWMARYWLPMLDLSATFDPVVWANQFIAGSAPNNVQNYWPPRSRGMGGAGWQVSELAQQVFGARSWEWIADPACSPGGGPRVSGSGGIDLNQFAWNSLVARGVAVGESSPECRGFDIRRYLCSFNWSQRTPTEQSYIWLALNLVNDDNAAWQVFPADLYRFDLQPGDPTRLPPQAWLDLNFLDAIHTGAHGMPVFVKPDGRLDFVALATWAAAQDDYRWGQLVSNGASDWMLATIYDSGAPAPRVVPYEPPLPSVVDQQEEADDPPPFEDDEELDVESPPVEEEQLEVDPDTYEDEYYTDELVPADEPDPFVEAIVEVLAWMQQQIYNVGPKGALDGVLALLDAGLDVDLVLDLVLMLEGGDLVLMLLLELVGAEPVEDGQWT